MYEVRFFEDQHWLDIDDSQSLRKDYTAERERVDTMLTTLLRIADRSSRT